MACIARDTRRNRRPHPAFVGGGLLVIPSWPLRPMQSGTDAWMRFAQWLIA